MNEQQSSKKILWIVGGVASIIILGFLGYYFLYSISGQQKTAKLLDKPVVLREELVLPETTTIALSDTRSVNTEAYKVSLVPKNDGEKVVVEKAVYTLKEGYAKALPEALVWSPDAKLILVKSLSAITLEGRSSQWQIIFGSKVKKGGYEIIIQADQIASQKPIDSTSYGYSIPDPWYDAQDAIVSLQTLPGFADATVTGINFFYNIDAKQWRYGFATSKGATAVPVR